MCISQKLYGTFLKKEETENVMDELGDIQDKLDRIEKKLEEDAGKKYSSFSSDAEKKNFMENQIS